MTDIHFSEIDASEVQSGFPQFYGPRGRFFEIVHKGCPIGFVGVRPLGMDCELSVFVFRQYRNALTKGMVLAVLGLPPTLGFKKCWMATTLKTVAKLLNAMGKADGRLPAEGRPVAEGWPPAKGRPPYGVMPVGFRQGKAIFVKEYCGRE